MPDLDFAKRFRQHCPHVPLICVPTSYAHLRFDVLETAGFNAVIYANHMLRSAYMAMRDVAVGILEHGRTLEVEPRCLGIEEIHGEVKPADKDELVNITPKKDETKSSS